MQFIKIWLFAASFMEGRDMPSSIPRSGASTGALLLGLDYLQLASLVQSKLTKALIL